MSPRPDAVRRLASSLDELQRSSGPPPPFPHVDPLHQILHENVAYLVDDRRREEAFAGLRERVGLEPAAILAAPVATLREIAGLGGMLPDQRVGKLLRIAELALRHFPHGLREVLTRPGAEARKALMRFPGIGEPGAEKILLFSGAQPVLALDSNGLRVLLRLGYGEAHKSYSASYRSAQTAASAELPRECHGLQRAHLLLRRHGQQTCKRSRPLCGGCPLRGVCPYYAKGSPR